MMSQIMPPTALIIIIVGVPQVESRLGRRIRQAWLEHPQVYENKKQNEECIAVPIP
jgi:hypothetical protein